MIERILPKEILKIWRPRRRTCLWVLQWLVFLHCASSLWRLDWLVSFPFARSPPSELHNLEIGISMETGERAKKPDSEACWTADDLEIQLSFDFLWLNIWRFSGRSVDSDGRVDADDQSCRNNFFPSSPISSTKLHDLLLTFVMFSLVLSPNRDNSRKPKIRSPSSWSFIDSFRFQRFSTT